MTNVKRVIKREKKRERRDKSIRIKTEGGREVFVYEGDEWEGKWFGPRRKFTFKILEIGDDGKIKVDDFDSVSGSTIRSYEKPNFSEFFDDDRGYDMHLMERRERNLRPT